MLPLTAARRRQNYCFAPKKLIAYHEACYVRGWVVFDKGRVEREYDHPMDLPVHRLIRVVPTRRGSGHFPDVDGEMVTELSVSWKVSLSG